MRKSTAQYLAGFANFPGSGPSKQHCGSCGHFLPTIALTTGLPLKKGHCLRWLELRGNREGAAMARTGDVRAVFAARATAPAIPRATQACCEYEPRQKKKEAA